MSRGIASGSQASALGAIGEIKSSMLTLTQMQNLYGSGWVLCDGGSCAGSIYENITSNSTVPDLRAAFLRGAGTSTQFTQNHTTTLGGVEDDAIQSHTHESQLSTNPGGALGFARGDATYVGTLATTAPAGARTANETRPNNVGVNFFIRIN